MKRKRAAGPLDSVDEHRLNVYCVQVGSFCTGLRFGEYTYVVRFWRLCETNLGGCFCVYPISKGHRRSVLTKTKIAPKSPSSGLLVR